MSEILYQGTVVEARHKLLVLVVGPGRETTLMVKGHDASPGDFVWVYDDGQVEVKNRPSRLPEGVTERTFPTTLDGQDHS